MRFGGQQLRGFTLVEVVVSLALVSLTLLIGYRTLQWASGVSPMEVTSGEDVNARLEVVRALLARGEEAGLAPDGDLEVRAVAAVPALYEVRIADTVGGEHTTTTHLLAVPR